MAGDKPQRSTLLGFGACALCGGKTHIKRRTDVDGKRPYSHCVDEHETGCNSTLYARNATEERLMLGKMRPLQSDPPAAAPAAAPAAPAPAPAAAASKPASPPPAAPPAVPARRRLFGGLVVEG